MGDKEALEILDDILADAPVEEIVLEGCEFPKFTKALKEKIEKCKDATGLILNDCQIESLANFPKLPNVTRLELIGNKFKGSELKNIVPCLPKLEEIHLSDNDITSYDDIAPLKELKGLKVITLEGTPLAEKGDYREKLFATFPGLEVLDNMDKDGNELAAPEDEYDEGEEDEEEPEDDDEEYDEEEDEEYDAKGSNKKKKAKKN